VGQSRLFVAQFVLAIEEEWFASFASGTDASPAHSEVEYYVESRLFAAANEEEAYRTACDWLPGFEDANHDGKGDLTRYYAVGIHDIEEVDCAPDQLFEAVKHKDEYGVDVGRYHPKAVDAAGVPLVRTKQELDIFREIERLRNYGRRPPEDACLSCGAIVPPDASECPECGWNWSGDQED